MVVVGGAAVGAGVAAGEDAVISVAVAAHSQ
jgi:hypothetical protein